MHHASSRRFRTTKTRTGSGAAQFAVTHNNFLRYGRVSSSGLGSPMRRRAFITLLGGAAAWPLAARAQQGERMRRIGFLRAAPPPERELEAFLRGLADHGWVQGRNFVLVPQWGDGNVGRLSELAVTLVNTGVDIIVVEGVVTARAAQAVTTTIPIVTTAG